MRQSVRTLSVVLGLISLMVPAAGRLRASQATKPPHACDLLSKAELTKLSHPDAARFPPTREQMPKGETSCMIDGGGGRHINIIVTPGWTKANFDRAAKGFEGVPGVGDGAYYKAGTRPGEGAALYAIVPPYELYVGLQSNTESNATLRPVHVALAKAAAAKLR